jgi:hypothetical protein
MKRIDIVDRNYRRRIASLLPLRKGVSLSRVMTELNSAMKRFWLEYEINESRYHIELSDSALLLEPRRHKSKGRPKRAAMRTFIRELITIYERATEKKITRSVVHRSLGKYRVKSEDKHRPFLEFCIEVAGYGKIKEDDMTYSLHFIQQELQKLRKGRNEDR